MVEIPAAVEDDAFDSLFQGSLRNGFADPPGSLDIATGGTTQFLLNGRCRDDGLAELVVNYLRVYVIQAAIKSQPWPFAAAPYFPANPSVNRLANYCSTSVCHFFIREW